MSKSQTTAYVLLSAALSLLLTSPAIADNFRHLTQSGLKEMRAGNTKKAESLLKQASESVKGTKQPYKQYAESLLNLGLLYKKKKKVVISAKYYNEALDIYKKAYGEKSLQASNAYHGLGELYRTNKKYFKSIPYYRKALKIREVSASGHTDLAATCDGMAESLIAIDSEDEAVPLLKKSIAIKEKAYGKSNPKVAYSLNKLASIYYSQGKVHMALPAYKRLLGICEVSFGSNSPKVASTLERLGQTYAKRGKYAKADKLFARAIAIRRKRAKQMPDKLNRCKKNYVKLLRQMKQYNRADDLEDSIN